MANKARIRCQPPYIPYRRSGGIAASKLIPVVGRNHFQAVVGLGSSFPGWLSTEGSSQLVEDAHLPWLMVSPSSKPAMVNQVLLMLPVPWTPILPHLICFPFLPLRTHVITSGLPS